jgi:hypothetical protein
LPRGPACEWKGLPVAGVEGFDVRGLAALGDGTTDCTDVLQSILDGLPEGGVLRLPVGRFRVSGPLRVPGGRSVRGEGVSARYGSLGSGWDSIDTPSGPRLLAGSVIVQTGPGCDGLVLAATGEGTHLEGVGVEFEGPHRFQKTGHGVAAVPGRHGAGFDNGLSGSVWSNVMVAGHDGDHYAALVVNGIYNDFRALHSFGGGVLHLVNDSAVNGHYGNTNVASLYGQVFAGGSAHGICLESVTPWLNLIAFTRPQVTVSAKPESFPGIVPATAAQSQLKAKGDVRNVSLLQWDFETTVGSKPSPPAQTWWTDPAGFYYNLLEDPEAN